MACSRCKKKEIIELHYIKQKLCPDCFTKFFEKRVRRTIRRYEMLGPEDVTAVALSGGKDSMTVLTILKELSKKAPKSKLFALIIDEGVPGYRDKLIECSVAYCKKLGVPYHIFSFKDELGMTISEIMAKVGKNDRKSIPPCSYCGVFRRQLLNQKAREFGATKVATGHNLDDECETGLMNFLKGDIYRIARAGPVAGMVKNERFVPRIKPLYETPEIEVALYAKLKGIQTFTGRCKFAEDSTRTTLNKVLVDLEAKYPGIHYQMIGSISELAPVLREAYVKKSGAQPKMCKKCGEVASTNECKFCEMKRVLGL